MMRNIEAGVPLEAQWNDIDYMADNNSNYRDFTINKNYTDLDELVSEVHKRDMKYLFNIVS